MPTIIDSLLVRLGFKVEAQGLEGFAKHAEEARGIMLGLSAALTGAVVGIQHMVHSTAERMGGIWDFSEQMGISAREVDALGRVARENESSLEAMEGGIRGLTMMAIQADKHLGRGAAVFKKFGLNARDGNHHLKTAETLMGEVAEKMKGLSIGERNLLGSRLGFDPATIKLLSEGRAHFNKLREDALAANPFKESDYEQAELAEKAFRKAGDAVERLKNRLAVGLFPTVLRLIERFSAWSQDEKNIRKIQQAINDVVKVAEALWKHMDKLVLVFAIMKAKQYGTMFIGWGASLMKAALSMKNAASAGESLKLAFASLKGLLVGGLLGALGLLIEDFMVFERGGNSVTGWMLNKFPGGVEAMKLAMAGLATAIGYLSTGSLPLAIIVVGFLAWALAIRAIRQDWDILVTEIKQDLGWLANNPVFKALSKGLSKTKEDKEPSAVGPMGGTGALSGLTPAQQALLAKHKAEETMSIPGDFYAPGAGVMSPISLEPSPSWRMDQPHSVVTNQEITFHVTAHDTEGVKREVAKLMEQVARLDSARGRARDAQTGHR